MSLARTARGLCLFFTLWVLVGRADAQDGRIAGGQALGCTECRVGDLTCAVGSINGQLTPDDCDPGDGTSIDFYSFSLAEVSEFRIELESTDFDPIVGVFNSDCVPIFSNDTCAPDRPDFACLELRLEPGEYFVGVNNFEEGATGDYRLTIDCSVSVRNVCADCIVVDLPCDTSVAGQLDSGDCPLGDDTWIDLHAFELSEPGEVTLELSSAEFDTVIYLFDENCEFVSVNDDCDDDTNSCLTIELPAGRYFAGANSFEPRETGAYTFRRTGPSCTPGGGGGRQRPGDCNQDGRLDLSDGICLLRFLFQGGAPACSTAAAFQTLMNVNGDARVDLSDSVSVFTFLFLGGPPPARGLGCIEIADCASTCNP